MRYADWIRERRSSAGLSRVELATKVGVTGAIVKQWEQGTAEPGPTALKRLHKLLGGYSAHPAKDTSRAPRRRPAAPATSSRPELPSGTPLPKAQPVKEPRRPSASPPAGQNHLSWIANFIWGIADDVLRDLYVRGKYRDVILPMTVLRRLDTAAPPVIRKIHKKGAEPDLLRGLFAAKIGGKPAVVEYEPDPDLRDTEQVPLLEEGGIEAFLRREVLPHAPDAWYDPESVKTGYEISFTRYFYKPQPLRTLEEIRADILALEKETEGLLAEIIGGGAA
jgi:DNA-binding XRE family transcriptional regulator